jgi:hypothetical protein
VGGRFRPELCGADSLGLADLAGCVDSALVFAAAHEVHDVETLMVELAALLAANGRVLVVEPSGHVSAEESVASMAAARSAGLTVEAQPTIARSLVVLLAADPGGVRAGSGTSARRWRRQG